MKVEASYPLGDRVSLKPVSLIPYNFARLKWNPPKRTKNMNFINTIARKLKTVKKKKRKNIYTPRPRDIFYTLLFLNNNNQQLVLIYYYTLFQMSKRQTINYCLYYSQLEILAWTSMPQYWSLSPYSHTHPPPPLAPLFYSSTTHHLLLY